MTLLIIEIVLIAIKYCISITMLVADSFSDFSRFEMDVCKDYDCFLSL